LLANNSFIKVEMKMQLDHDAKLIIIYFCLL